MIKTVADPFFASLDETEACCREALTDCILKSIESDLVLGCEKTKSGKNAVTSGHCTYNKNAPRPSNKIKAPPKLKVTPDESCDACDPDVLKKSNILFNYDAIVFPEAAACSLAAPRGRFTALARITIHELLHLCVGGHMEKGEVNIFDRPDAADLADEFIANCWQ